MKEKQINQAGGDMVHVLLSLFAFLLVFTAGSGTQTVNAAPVTVTTESELLDAVTGADTAPQIMLGADINLVTGTANQAYGLNIEKGRQIELDLNGHTLSASDISTALINIQEGNSLTVCDGVGNGQILNTMTNSYGIYVDGGVFALKSGSVNALGYPAIATSDKTAGSVTISGGTVIGDNGALAPEGGSIRVSGGTIQTGQSLCLNSSFDIRITGGTFEYTGSDPTLGALYTAGSDIRAFAQFMKMNDVQYAFTDNSLRFQLGYVYTADKVEVVCGKTVLFHTNRTEIETIPSAENLEGAYKNTGSAAAITVGTGPDNPGVIYAQGFPAASMDPDYVAEAAEYELEGWYQQTALGSNVDYSKVTWEEFCSIVTGSPESDMIFYAKWNAKIKDSAVLEDKLKLALLKRVTLAADISLNAPMSVLRIGNVAHIELDLAGYTISAPQNVGSAVRVDKDASLVISDSGGTGMIQSVHSPAVACFSGAALTLAGGTFRTDQEGASAIAAVEGDAARLKGFLADGSHYDFSGGKETVWGEQAAYGSANSEVTVYAQPVQPQIRVDFSDLPEEFTYGNDVSGIPVSIENTGNVAVTLDAVTGGAMGYVQVASQAGALPYLLMPGEIYHDGAAVSATAGVKAGDYQGDRLSVSYTPDLGTQTSTDTPVGYRVLPFELVVRETEISKTKPYDGGRDAGVTNEGWLAGVIGGDDVAFTTTALYDTADVGTGKTITVSYTLSGADAASYTAPGFTTIGDITKADRTTTFQMPDYFVGENPPAPVWGQMESGTQPVYYYKQAEAADDTYVTEAPTVYGSYAVKAEVPDTGNYYAYTATDTFTVSYLPTPETPYTIEGTKGDNGWYQTAVRICPPAGYTICDTADGLFTECLSVEADQTFDIYLKSATGARTQAVSVSVKIDTTVPVCTGENDGIRMEKQVWKELLNKITFGIFLEKSTKVTISAQDAESGIAKYEYYISRKKMTLSQLKKHTGWESGNTCNITEKSAQENVVYAKVTNGAGLVTWLSSDGLVYDTQKPVISGAADGATVYADSLRLTVSDDYLKLVTVNGKKQKLNGKTLKLELPARNGSKYVVQAEDETGNVTKLTVSVHNGIDTSGKKNLKKGTAYQLGSGSWKVSGDNTLYSGNKTFYAVSDGEYEFIKQ